MENELWNESLRKSPFEKPRFTDEMKQEILYKAKNKPKAKVRLTRFGAVFAIMIVCIGILFASDKANVFTSESENSKPTGSDRIEEVRTEYARNGIVLFQVFPDPDLIAGARRGYMIHFTQPFKTFEGKRLSVVAYHHETGKQLTVVAPETITEPSPGYDSLDRFTARFNLPLAGTWKYEIKLNDQFYGDFVLEVGEHSPWTGSDTFDIPYIGVDGKSHKYVLVGEKGKVGFIIGPYQNENGEILDQQPIVAGKRHKYMWHFWGNKDELKGHLSIMAVKEGSKREIDIFNTFGLGGSIHGADAHIPTSMGFPEAGMWRINAYLDDRLFGSIYVKVES
ncbi:DUF4871 domain-containing protein [Cohnella luojiensis]|uniref:DUF4871 domain-containing protein n=1 Tax=Cohnella luojiensis TaxID=652876 RepID=A0A4Y8LTW3_9BACL|nr:DUF4871 domain-containing protein [Cohnella luojiensis]TFE24848.1 DUF4871 domain-containing protein [Cohnella luojiensis]